MSLSPGGLTMFVDNAATDDSLATDVCPTFVGVKSSLMSLSPRGLTIFVGNAAADNLVAPVESSNLSSAD